MFLKINGETIGPIIFTFGLPEIFSSPFYSIALMTSRLLLQKSLEICPNNTKLILFSNK